MKIITLSTCLSAFLCATALHAVTIDFTAGESYSDGALDGQNSWVAQFYGVADTAGVGQVNFPLGFNNGNATYNDANLSGTDLSYTVAGIFSFVADSSNTVAGFNNTFRLDFREGGIGNGAFDFGTALQLQRRSGGTWALNRADNGGFASSSTFTDADLGLSLPGDTLSDALQMTYTITRGAGLTDWGYTGSIFNITTATLVETYSGTLSVDSAFANAAELDVAINATTAGSSGELTSIALTSLELSSVPEPSQSALFFGLGLAVLCLVRRRRS
ncbi:MAG: PEP-CTERM sorting domain-containing protein [Verrucomicrobiota bacterium]